MLLGLSAAALVWAAAQGSLMTYQGFVASLTAVACAINTVQDTKIAFFTVLVLSQAGMCLTQTAFCSAEASADLDHDGAYSRAELITAVPQLFHPADLGRHAPLP